MAIETPLLRVHFQRGNFPLSQEWPAPMAQALSEALKNLFGQEMPPSEFSLRLVGDTEMAHLNKKYRGQEKTTDVLSFPVHENLRHKEGELFALPLLDLGDVVISFPMAVKQAQQHRIPLLEELAHLVAHGFLHLLGYGHKMDHQAREMFALEEKIVDLIREVCP